jgi:hypothetical protein
MLSDRSTVGSAIGWPLKLALEFCPRLDEPTLPERYEQDRVDLGVDQILPTGDEAERTGVAGKDRDWLFGIRTLGDDPCRRQEQKK